MATETDKPINGAPQPFRRPVMWGRPPATVFRAGPLPKGERLPPLPEPPRTIGSGILSGSMIPRAAPAPKTDPAHEPAPVDPMVSAAPEPREAPVAAPIPAPAPKPAPTAASWANHAADLTVRPLPPRQPARPAAPLQLDALPAFQPTVRDEIERPAPGHAPAARRTANRTPLYAGVAVAAATVLALGAWIWLRPTVEAPVVAAAPPAAAVVAATAPAPVLDAPPAPVPVIETPAATAAPATLTPPVRPTAARPSPAPAAAARVPAPASVRPAAPPSAEAAAPPPIVVVAPLIEIAPAPPPGPAPTEAERPQADPDSPIATRPQPLGQGTLA